MNIRNVFEFHCRLEGINMKADTPQTAAREFYLFIDQAQFIV